MKSNNIFSFIIGAVVGYFLPSLMAKKGDEHIYGYDKNSGYAYEVNPNFKK